MKLSPTIPLYLLFLFPAYTSAQESAIGTTEPIREVHMSFPEAGVIAAIPVQEGQRVSKDELLAKLNLQVLEASLRMAKIKADSRSAIQSAQANWDLRNKRLNELQRLAESGSANRDEVARARADFEISNAELTAAQEENASLAIQVEQISAQIERRILRSPFDGIVTRVYCDEGENVQPGQGPVVSVVKLDQLHLILHIPHQAAERLKPGQTVPVRRLGSDSEYLAQLEFVSPVTDSASSTTRVKLVLDNETGIHRSGIKYEVDLSRIRNQLALRPIDN